MPTPPAVVVTLVHGTVLFARWPRLVGAVRWLLPARRARRPEDIEWHRPGSAFRRRLRRAIGTRCHLTTFRWSGANSEWVRLCAAGADRDFSDDDAGAPAAGSLRAHITRTRERFPRARLVLVAHSHGGNVCLAALRDPHVRAAVDGLVCLSTPFVNVRARADAAVLVEFLYWAGLLAMGAALFGSIYWVSRLVPEPWDSLVWTAGFMIATLAWVLGSARTRRRREALRRRAQARPQATAEPATLILLADGDEALLALKVAEGVNATLRGTWRVVSALPLAIFAVQRRWGNRWQAALPVYVSVSVAVLIWLLISDASLMSPGLVAKAILAAVVLPGFLLLAWSLLLALPVLLVTPIGFGALGLLRWLAFGWAGTFDLEMTAETCPVGSATIIRLGPRLGSRGLRHGHSYNDRRAPVHIGRFISRIAATARVGGDAPTARGAA
jgi:hypothetical protein